MPTQYPALPNIDPEQPTALGDALDYLGRFRSAAEERDSSIQALAFSPDGSLWQGRSLPSTTGAVAQPTGLQAFGLYDNIALVWDFDPDPAIIGWEITRDSVVRDVATDFSYVDRPGDTSSHTYTVKAVREDGTRSLASASAAASATTSESTARANYAAAVLARQSAAVRPTAATIAVSGFWTDSQSTTSASYVDMPSTSISVTSPGAVPILLIGSSMISQALHSGATEGMVEVRAALLRGTTVLQETILRGFLPAIVNETLISSLTLVSVDTPAAGTYTYKMQYRAATADTAHLIADRSLQAVVLKR